MRGPTHTIRLMTCSMLCLCAAIRVWADELTPLSLQPEYKAMFNLDDSDPRTALEDPDEDKLLTIQEQRLRTDPYAFDSDLDGVGDGDDPDPMDRLVVDWGAIDFTDGDIYRYVAPAWFVSAFKSGGVWVADPTGWQPDRAEPLSTFLRVDFDRAETPSNLVAHIEYTAPVRALLAFSLVNADDTDLSDLAATTVLQEEPDLYSASVPLHLDACPEAVGVRIQTRSPDVIVLNTIVFQQIAPLAPDDSNDPSESTRSALSSSYGGGDAPSKGEVSDGVVPLSVAAGTDPKGLAADVEANSMAAGSTIYVDAAAGNDTYTGRLSASGAGDGPKRTIAAGLFASRSGGTVVVAAGTYAEGVVLPHNVKLVTRGRVVIN